MRWPGTLPLRLAVFDMDSTLIQAEVIDELARLHGVHAQVSEVTRRAMAGELDFEQSLRQRVATLQGLEVNRLAELAQSLPLMDGAEALLAGLRAMRCRTAVVSGGFMFAARVVKSRLGLDHAYANTLAVAEGKLTGEVVGAVVTPDRKAEVFAELLALEGCAKESSMAVGDGANDRLMLAAAGVGVAFHAKPVLREAADVVVDEGALDQLLPWLSPS
ncbi:MAG: phosphoserine phosphatase SerB [Myxococcota bacterium]